MAVRRNKSRKTASTDKQPQLTPLQQALLDESNRRVTIIADGRQQEISIHQVVSRKLLQMAANGSVHALSNAVNEINTAQRLKREVIDADVSFGYRYKAHQQTLLDDALKKYQDPEMVLPHPDDIVVTEGKGYRIDGPMDDAGLAIIQRNCEIRDVLILQAVLEERIGDCVDRNLGEEDPGSIPGASALVFVHFMNDGLPTRFHKSDMRIITEIGRCRRLTKRELLKKVRQAWASIGKPKPRGWVMPSLSEIRSKSEFIIRACVDLVHEVRADELSSDREIATRLTKLNPK